MLLLTYIVVKILNFCMSSQSEPRASPSAPLFVLMSGATDSVWSMTIHVAMYVIMAVSMAEAFFSGVAPPNAPGGTNCEGGRRAGRKRGTSGRRREGGKAEREGKDGRGVFIYLFFAFFAL